MREWKGRDERSISNMNLHILAIIAMFKQKAEEEAQSWLYELPGMYYGQLAQEGLVINMNDSEKQSVST